MSASGQASHPETFHGMLCTPSPIEESHQSRSILNSKAEQRSEANA